MVTIITYDMRKGRVKDLEKSTLRWYPALCDTMFKSLIDVANARTSARMAPWQDCGVNDIKKGQEK